MTSNDSSTPVRACALREDPRAIAVDGDLAAQAQLAALLDDATEIVALDATPEAGLQAAIDTVTAAGLLVVDASARAIAGVHRTANGAPLTGRERDVLALLVRGFSNKRIGARLSISEHTAKFHVGSVLAKLGAATRAEAVALGVRRGYVTL